MAEPSPEAVREQVERIAASPGFVQAERLRRFLRFTVEARLRGEQDQLKEFLIGTEVFDRNGSYDPRLDAIVRVEARRLRVRLAEYYQGVGRQDPIRIEYPKGSYAPAFLAARAARPKRRRWLVGVVGSLTLAAGLALVRQGVRPGGLPLIAVLPATWIWADQTGLDRVDESLAELVTAEAAGRPSLAVAGWPAIASRRSSRLDTVRLAQDLGASLTLAVSVRRAQGRGRVTVFLSEASTERKRWVEDYFLEDPANLEQQREAARRIVAGLEAKMAAIHP
jgi:TolB-like protein